MDMWIIYVQEPENKNWISYNIGNITFFDINISIGNSMY